MARPRATPEQREETQRGIREAAESIFSTQGVCAISARSVALKAGVSVGTIYAHFGDLTGLIQALWTERIQHQNVDFRNLISLHDDALDRLRALLKAYLRFGFENTDLYTAAFLSVKPGAPRKAGPAPLDATEFPTLLIDTLVECQAARQVISGEPALLAQIVWSGLHGCLALPAHVDRRRYASVQEIAEPMVEALIRAVRTPE